MTHPDRDNFINKFVPRAATLVETDVTNGGCLVAKVTQTRSVLRPRT
ncbi:MAG: hypothetical protein OER95_17150 [Acidimicrobiia bacterium]|nr:hypothetical protein [Acidimicrobiia bacterium]